MNNRSAILIVVCSLAMIAILGEWCVFRLIEDKAEGVSIAILANFAGVALGALSSMLNNTRSESPKTEITNTPDNPVPVSDPTPK